MLNLKVQTEIHLVYKRDFQIFINKIHLFFYKYKFLAIKYFWSNKSLIFINNDILAIILCNSIELSKKNYFKTTILF